MRLLLLTLLMSSSLYCTAQFIGGGISYYYDRPTNFPWTTNHGVQVGIGIESTNFYDSPLTYSIRYNGLFNIGREGTRVENIEFDLPNSVVNRFGYADIKFKKFNFGLEYDLGYRESWSNVEPYGSFGARLSNNTSWVEYELYEQDSCFCTSSLPEEVSQTLSLGFNTGIGVKFHAGDIVIFDIRATYYGTWGLGRNEFPGAPDPESFHIDPYGTPSFNYSEQNYFGGFEFRVGVIFNIAGGSGSSGSWDSDSSSDSDDSNDGNSSSSEAGGSSGKSCEPLSPKGRGGL